MDAYFRLGVRGMQVSLARPHGLLFSLSASGGHYRGAGLGLCVYVQDMAAFFSS